MNSTLQNENEERKKLFDNLKLLENTSEANIKNIISCKSRLETINDKILLNKKLVDNYENKLEELMSIITNNEWSQVRATTVLKIDMQFFEELKNKIDNEQGMGDVLCDSVTNKTLELKQEKEILEMQCKTNDKIIKELHNEIQKLKEDIL